MTKVSCRNAHPNDRPAASSARGGVPARERQTAYPLVNFVVTEARARSVTLAALAERVGCDRASLTNLGRRSGPSLRLIERCLSALGFDLCPVPRAHTKQKPEKSA